MPPCPVASSRMPALAGFMFTHAPDREREQGVRGRNATAGPCAWGWGSGHEKGSRPSPSVATESPGPLGSWLEMCCGRFSVHRPARERWGRTWRSGVRPQREALQKQELSRFATMGHRMRISLTTVCR